MPYLDDTENGVAQPDACPLCREKLVLRWRGQVMSRMPRRGYLAQAWPLFVCLKCKITVRVSALPKEPLRATREKARQDVADKIATKNAELEANRQRLRVQLPVVQKAVPARNRNTASARVARRR